MTTRRVALLLLAVPAVALAALGTVVTPPAALISLLVLAPGLAALTGYALAGGRGDHDVSGVPPGPVAAHRRGVRSGLVWAGGAAAAVPVVAGLVVLAGPATGPLLLLAGFAALPWVWARLRRRRERRALEHREHPPAAPVEANPAPGPRPLVRVLASLSTPALCAEWQRSFGVLTGATDQAGRDDVAELRRRYLDELERRDPTALGRWLAADARPAGTNPARHLSPEDPHPGCRDRNGHPAPGTDHDTGTGHAA